MTQTDVVNGEVLKPDGRDKLGRFTKATPTSFQPGNPGKPHGVRNKFSEAYLQDFFDVWLVKGKAAIETLADEDPATFVRIGQRILPREVSATIKGGLTISLGRRHDDT